jgi:acetylglutamate kinase
MSKSMHAIEPDKHSNSNIWMKNCEDMEMHIKNSIEKAKTLTEALPYMKKFENKVFVIKYGGSAMKDPKMKKMIIQDIELLKRVGIIPVVVHGGGSEIGKWLAKLNIQSQFIDGLRITDKETMEVVEMVLSGKINKKIVEDIQQIGLNAVGISGKDGATIIARKKIHGTHDLGYVGEIEEINTGLIKGLVEHGIIPVIAPVGMDSLGNTYNINADYAAAAIGAALHAEKLIYLTDVAGVLANEANPNSVIPSLNPVEVEKLTASEQISGGMIPKVQCCISAVQNGVNRVHILDGKIEHALLLEIFTQQGIGTMFEKERGGGDC